MGWLRALLGAMIVCGSGSAMAQEALLPPEAIFFEPQPLISEVRLGFHFHDAYSGFLPTRPERFEFERLQDISLDVLFSSPDIDAFRWIGSPRPELGATINLDGKENLVHLGLTWQAHLFDSPVFVEGSLGLAANSGYLNDAPEGYRSMGCRVQFYERFGVGADLGENLSATLTYEHTSNAELCSANAGLSNLGVRLGWKF